MKFAQLAVTMFAATVAAAEEEKTEEKKDDDAKDLCVGQVGTWYSDAACTKAIAAADLDPSIAFYPVSGLKSGCNTNAAYKGKSGDSEFTFSINMACTAEANTWTMHISNDKCAAEGKLAREQVFKKDECKEVKLESKTVYAKWAGSVSNLAAAATATAVGIFATLY